MPVGLVPVSSDVGKNAVVALDSQTCIVLV